MYDLDIALIEAGHKKLQAMIPGAETVGMPTRPDGGGCLTAYVRKSECIYHCSTADYGYPFETKNLSDAIKEIRQKLQAYLAHWSKTA